MSLCVSVASPSPEFRVLRVIEYLLLAQTAAQTRIFVDVFVSNASRGQGKLELLHRGGLDVAEVTAASWIQKENNGRDTDRRALARRIQALHTHVEPIEVLPDRDAVRVGGIDFSIWDRPTGFRVETGGGTIPAVPFTLWRVDDVPPGTHLFRFELQLDRESFEDQIGPEGKIVSFEAYGESILLHKIESTDLPALRPAVAEEYSQRFLAFTQHRITPEAFEFLLVSRIGEPLKWRATPLTPNLSDMWIEDGSLRETTRWFRVDRDPWWNVKGSSVTGSELLDLEIEVAVA